MEFSITILAYLIIILTDLRKKFKEKQSKKELWIYIIVLAISFAVIMLYLKKPYMNSISHYITIFVDKFVTIKEIH